MASTVETSQLIQWRAHCLEERARHADNPEAVAHYDAQLADAAARLDELSGTALLRDGEAQ